MSPCPDLDKLAAIELRLVSELRSPRGASDQAERELRVAHEYREVHQQYVRLLSRPACEDEALKRAIFLQWIMTVEPPFLSGLRSLDDSSTLTAFAELERRAAAGLIDEELLGMLTWYFELADWAFPSSSDLPSVYALVASSAHAQPQVKRPLSPRGQMAVYWNSLRT